MDAIQIGARELIAVSAILIIVFGAGMAVGVNAVLMAIREEREKDQRIVEGANVVQLQPRGVRK